MNKTAEALVDEQKLPRRSVSREEFQAAALRAGWYPAVIKMFLNPICPMPSKHTKVGQEMLVVK